MTPQAPTSRRRDPRLRRHVETGASQPAGPERVCVSCRPAQPSFCASKDLSDVFTGRQRAPSGHLSVGDTFSSPLPALRPPGLGPHRTLQLTALDPTRLSSHRPWAPDMGVPSLCSGEAPSTSGLVFLFLPSRDPHVLSEHKGP